MTIYVYKCNKCEAIKEIITTNINQNIVLDLCECGGAFEKAPSSSAFKINGYSYSNGYDKTESINYDGSDRSW